MPRPILVVFHVFVVAGSAVVLEQRFAGLNICGSGAVLLCLERGGAP